MDDSAMARRLRALYAGVLYDALTFDLSVTETFLLERAISPARWQPADVVVAGPAFTCGGQVVARREDLDDLHRLRMLSALTPGCVQVIAAGGDRTCAHFGDVSGRLAAARGAIGVVIDGNTRDARRLAVDAFPVYCRDVTPVDAYGRWQLVRHQHDEVVAGDDGPVTVSPGDWIFGDGDGVLRIRAGDVEKAVLAAEERGRREHDVRSRLGTEDPLDLYREVGRW
jgi:4-hydroxy-4-methyl-2-oxoglutarate aldolase